APGTYTWAGNTYLRDGSETSLLKIDIKHNGTTTAQLIEFGSISVWFSSGTTQLSAGSMTGLFEYVAVYRDSLLIGSTTSFSNGTQTFNLYGSTTDTNWIAGLQTGNFFLKVKLKPSASGSVTRTFKAILVGTTGCTIRDAVSKIILEQVNSTGSESTKITAIPVNPKLIVQNSAPIPAWIRDSEKDDLLMLYLRHNGSSTAERIEFATLTVQFYGSVSGAFSPMTKETAQGLFKNILVYYSSNDTYETLTDTYAIGTLTNTELANNMSNQGTITFTFIDNATCTVGGAGTKTYFLVVEMMDDASAWGTKTFFAATITTQHFIRIEDDELEIPLEFSLIEGSSTQVIALPPNPTVKVQNIAIGIQDDALKDGSSTAILRVDVIHEGTTTSGTITLTKLPIFFGRPEALTNATMTTLFGSVTVYYDQNKDYQWNDTEIAGSITDFTGFLQAGLGTINITAFNDVGGGGSKTYFVVCHLRDIASTITTMKEFLGSISTTGDYPTIVDKISQIRLSLSGTSTGSQSTQLKTIPVNPTVTVSDYVPQAPGTYTWAGNTYLRDGSETAILKIDVGHNGVIGAGLVEVSTLTVYFASGTTQLTNLSSLCQHIKVWRSANAVWEPSDTVVGTITLFGNDGTETFTITGDNLINGASTGTFFLSIKLNQDASTQSTRTISAGVIGTSGVICRDWQNKIILDHTGSNVATSTYITAIPVNLGLTSSDSAPTTPSTMGNDVRDDLLKVILTHNGTKTAEFIEFATATLNFAQDSLGNIPITKSGGQGLFSGVYV
ncbi:MAG: hypothetical protein AAB296_08570, partial [Candidatus Desantisbacteria bacterium]